MIALYAEQSLRQRPRPTRRTCPTVAAEDRGWQTGGGGLAQRRPANGAAGMASRIRPRGARSGKWWIASSLGGTDASRRRPPSLGDTGSFAVRRWFAAGFGRSRANRRHGDPGLSAQAAPWNVRPLRVIRRHRPARNRPRLSVISGQAVVMRRFGLSSAQGTRRRVDASRNGRGACGAWPAPEASGASLRRRGT